MKKIKAILCVFMLALLITSSTKTTTIFVIGDSTAAEKDGFRNSPERGCSSGGSSLVRLALPPRPS